MEENKGTVAPSQVIINGKEYDPAEAQNLIELGNKYRETETKYNTKLENVFPEYTRSTQKAKELEEKLADRERQLTEYQKAKEAADKPEDVVKVQEEARKAGILLKEDLASAGYLTREDAIKFFQSQQAEREAVQKVWSDADALEKEIDGADGRIPFVKEAVISYAAQLKINDLKEAYEQMYARHNAVWKERQIEGAQTKGLSTINGTSSKKEPARVKITDDNVEELLREALWGNNG